MVIGFYSDDIFNQEKRNESTAYTEEYNCAGYALGTFNWFLPYSEDMLDEYDDEIYDEKYNVDYFADYLLETFNNLRMIENLDQAKDNEEIIALRLGKWGDDFHFLRRKLNKKWYHKLGVENVTRFKEPVFSDEWCNRYVDKIILFAKKG